MAMTGVRGVCTEIGTTRNVDSGEPKAHRKSVRVPACDPEGPSPDGPELASMIVGEAELKWEL